MCGAAAGAGGPYRGPMHPRCSLRPVRTRASHRPTQVPVERRSSGKGQAGAHAVAKYVNCRGSHSTSRMRICARRREGPSRRGSPFPPTRGSKGRSGSPSFLPAHLRRKRRRVEGTRWRWGGKTPRRSRGSARDGGIDGPGREVQFALEDSVVRFRSPIPSAVWEKEMREPYYDGYGGVLSVLFLLLHRTRRAGSGSSAVEATPVLLL